MIDENVKDFLYVWKGVRWTSATVPSLIKSLCIKCNCPLRDISGWSRNGSNEFEYNYYCVNCESVTSSECSLSQKREDFSKVLEYKSYKNYKVINIDGELFEISRQKVKDDDYWIDVKISKDKKGKNQIMILVGSKKEKDKTQLFIVPEDQRVTFDQNDNHPSEVLSKVEITFKSSKTVIQGIDKNI